MLTTLPAARSPFSLSRLEEIARTSQLVVRNSRKFSPAHFLFILLKSACSGQASFNQLAMSLEKTGLPAMSKQGVHKRINRRAVAFLLGVVKELLENHSADALVEFERAGFNRILVEDSSTLRLPKSNAELFPAHGNANGTTAGVKCNLCYDMLSQNPVSFELYRATEQDRAIGKETLVHARKGDLIMRDMGYFDLREFTYLESVGAYWLTRLPLTVNLVISSGEALETCLEKASGNEIDREVVVGKLEHRCRLVAVRADKQTAEKRRRERRAKAKELGKTASRAALIRDGWHLMLTNLPTERINVDTLAKLYRARWAIEIQFRAWKQSLQMSAALNRRSNKWHLEALVISAMIVALMGLKQMAVYARKVSLEKLSPEKIADWISGDILTKQSIVHLFTDPPDLRHVQRDTRLRKSAVNQGLRALS